MNAKLMAVIAAIALISLSTCATTGGSTNGLSLLEAIEQSAERIAAQLPAKSRVAIVAFESQSDNLSDYIMEEFAGALFDRNIEVADRQNLEYVYKELNFQMSGDVSDETAQSIGKFLGAQLVITGQLRHLGDTYRFMATAIRVEEATRASVPRFDVRNDRAMQNMITALDRQTTTTRTARYGVNETTTPQTAGTFLDRGILFASRGDYEMAIADFTEAIRMNPNLFSAYILRGRALRASVSKVIDVAENFSAITTTRTGRQVSPEQARIYDWAIADFTQAIRLDPTNTRAYNGRGTTYHDKGDYDRAIADYTQAIRLDTNYADAYNNRGLAYWDKRDYDRAIIDYNQAIRLAPNDGLAYINRGNVYYANGDYDRAIADYTQVIRLDPNYVVAYTNRGNVHYDNGDYDRAIADYTQVIRLDPNNANAYNDRGNAYYMRRDYDRAIADYEAALRIDPNDAHAREWLENARQRRGR